jgi:hypothetical protein
MSRTTTESSASVVLLSRPAQYVVVPELAAIVPLVSPFIGMRVAWAVARHAPMVATNIQESYPVISRMFSQTNVVEPYELPAELPILEIFTVLLRFSNITSP